MINLIAKRMAKGEKGFTLIELLIVIVIIAILIAVAIPAFLGARKRGQDSAAKSLLRNGQTAMESYFVDNQTYAGAGAAELDAIEANITWVEGGNGDAAANTVGIAAGATATDYELRSLSASGAQFKATKSGGVVEE